MADRSPILFLVLALAISWLAGAMPSQAEGEEGAGAKLRRVSTAESLESMWWNDPALVEALELSDASRSEMDDHCRAFVENRPERADRGVRRPFEDALREGDWEQARQHLRKRTEEAGKRIEAQGELKIRVLSLLSDEQRARLVEKKPNLLRQVWSPRRLAGPGRQKPPGRPAAE